MSTSRSVNKKLTGEPSVDGAGVRLRRVFGYPNLPDFDPFLLLDDFRNDDPDLYRPGFPWHPHRGIETITYMLEGEVEHGDSLGNSGIIDSGDVQWMTAGSGIIHQEMPLGAPNGHMYGFQLWANLPATDKMIAPRYRGFTAAEIPQVALDDGVTVKVLCGEVNGVRGPVAEVVIEPEYLDVHIPAGAKFSHPTKTGHTVFAYIYDGEGLFGSEREAGEELELILFNDGDRVEIVSERSAVSFLLISGRPLGEPVAWRGPIVMNTQEELDLAFAEYRNGTFVKGK